MSQQCDEVIFSLWNDRYLFRFHLVQQRFPFNWQDPIGFLVAAVIEYIEVIYSFALVACMLSLGIGSFIISVSQTSDAKNNLKAINEGAKTNESRLRIWKQLGDYIQFHSSVKKFSRTFSKNVG